MIENASLSDQVLKGDRKSVSRAISILENKEQGYADLLKSLYPKTGRAFVIGITGPPGTGKSTLVDQLVKIFRSKKVKVAVLAVDPTSPISGGAILGDRVRMLDHALDEGVYIRSMASRGDEGGLSREARNAVRVLDAAGNDIIFVETVGIGQAEAEIVKVADLVLVVLMPELGDEIQAIKAGLMEIGDVFVVNKSDLPGADKVIYNIESVLSSKSGWKQRALKASAKNSEGLDELVSLLIEFKEYLAKSEKAGEEKKQKLGEELIEIVSLAMNERLRNKLLHDPVFHAQLDKVTKRQEDPESAAQTILKQYLLTKSTSGIDGKTKNNKKEEKGGTVEA